MSILPPLHYLPNRSLCLHNNGLMAPA